MKLGHSLDSLVHERVALHYANALSRALGDLQAVQVELDAILRTLPTNTCARHRARLERARSRTVTAIARGRAEFRT